MSVQLTQGGATFLSGNVATGVAIFDNRVPSRTEPAFKY